MKKDETEVKEVKKRKRQIDIATFEIGKLNLEQKIWLVKKLEESIAEDKKNLEAQLSLINGKL